MSKATVEDYLALGQMAKAQALAKAEGRDFNALVSSWRKETKPEVAAPIIPPAFPKPKKPKVVEIVSAPVSSQPSAESQLGLPPTKYTAANFDNPVELLVFVYPHIRPFKWQAEEMMRFAGYVNIHKGDRKTRIYPTDQDPLFHYISAVNGSGKDAIVVTACAAWFAVSKIRSRSILVSASHDQLKDQTFKFIYDFCATYNERVGSKDFDCTHFNVINTKSGSQIKGRATDDPGKAEGFHPFADVPNAEMCVMVNEAKSIDDEMFTAYMRFTGYNRWMEISSPGAPAGHFFKRCMDEKTVAYPAPFHIGRPFWRKITAFECPNIAKAHIDLIRMEHGEDSILYMTSVLCEFHAMIEGTFIPIMMFNYRPPSACTYDLPLRAGLDVALGGDESVFDVWLGNSRVGFEVTKRRETSQVVAWIKWCIDTYKVKPEDVSMDIGGLGRPIWHNVKQLGLAVRGVDSGSKAHNKELYNCRGTEIWAKIRRLIEKQIIILPDEPKLRRQLSTRLFEVNGTKIALQKKEELSESPDRADAMALAFSQTPLAHFLSFTPETTRIKVSDLEARLKTGTLAPTEILKIQQQYARFREDDPMRLGSMYDRFAPSPSAKGTRTIYESIRK